MNLMVSIVSIQTDQSRRPLTREEEREFQQMFQSYQSKQINPDHFFQDISVPEKLVSIVSIQTDQSRLENVTVFSLI